MDSMVYSALHQLTVRPVWEVRLRIAYVAIIAISVFTKRRNRIQRRIEMLAV